MKVTAGSLISFSLVCPSYDKMTKKFKSELFIHSMTSARAWKIIGARVREKGKERERGEREGVRMTACLTSTDIFRGS